MKTLDLFCVTKSFSKIADKYGYETHTLDILDKFNPTYLTDIMQWDYKQFPPGYFHIIWASPNCKDYSSLNFFCGDKDLTHSNNLIKRVLEIIEYYNPQYWYMENPQTGKLKDQDFMVGLPFNDIDYWKYGYDYRKRTRVWNNNENWDDVKYEVPENIDTLNNSNIITDFHIFNLRWNCDFKRSSCGRIHLVFK